MVRPTIWRLPGLADSSRLAAGTVAAHAAAEDALFGDAAGDEVPEEAWSPRSRDSRIRAALASLHAEREAAEAERAARAEEHVAAVANEVSAGWVCGLGAPAGRLVLSGPGSSHREGQVGG